MRAAAAPTPRGDRRRARRAGALRALLRTGVTAAASLAAHAALQAHHNAGAGCRPHGRPAVQLPAWFPGAA